MTPPTQTAAERFAPVFLRILRMMVDKPDSILIDSEEGEGETSWSFSCDVNDAKKIVGAGKSRLVALEHFVRVVGEEAREEWRIAMPCRTTGVFGESKRATPPKDYKATDEALLLVAMLELVGVTAAITTAHNEDVIDLRILTTTEGRARLLTPDSRELTLIGSLGTAFRGIGGRVGVKLHLEVV